MRSSIAILLYFCIYSWDKLSANGSLDSLKAYTPLNILANITFVHGFVQPANNSIVPGGWSIGTEMAFYAVFPLLFDLCKIASKRSAWGLAVPVAISLLLSFGFQHLATAATGVTIKNDNFIYYNLFNQMPVFVLGMTGYFLMKLIPDHPICSNRLISLFAFLALSVGVVTLWIEAPPLWPMCLPPLSGLAFLFLLNLARLRQPKEGWLSRVGKVSYSMYIFHFVSAWWVLPYIFRVWLPFLEPYTKFGCCYVLTVLFTFAIACVTEKFVEQRGIALGARIVNSNKVLAQSPL